MKTPSISVVISCYNYGRYLARAVDSALGQQYEDLEVIVVNDGSTDDSDDVMRPYLADPRIVYVKQDNRGQAGAKNTGVRTARGEFVAFLDADDVWKPDKLLRQHALFADPGVAVVYSRADYIDRDGSGVPAPERGKRLTPRSGQVTEQLIFDNFVPFSTSIVRRKVLERENAFDETLAMGIDWDLWLRISVRDGFDFVNEPLIHYRVGHPGQMSKNSLTRQECSDRIIRSFLERNPGVLSPQLIRRSCAYRYAARGYRWRFEDPRQSNAHYLSALRSWPLEPMAYKGLLRNLLARYVGLPSGRSVRNSRARDGNKPGNGS